MKTKLLFYLLLVFVSGVRAQSWSPEMMMQYDRVVTADIASDGSKVAYEVSSPEMKGEKSEYVTQIWVAKTDGSMNRQYTFGDKSCIRAGFSHDNQFLSFTSSRNGKSELYLMPLDGGEAFPITDQKYAVGNYAWAPDGKSIAFLMTDPLTEQEEKDIKEKRDWVVADHFRNSHLYLISLKKNEKGEYPVRRLTRGDFHITELTWSPDSKTIAFTHQPNSSSEGWYNSDISTIPADSGEIKIFG